MMIKSSPTLIWQFHSKDLVVSLSVSLSLSACQGLFDFLCIEPYGDPSLLGFFLSGSPLFLIFCPLGSLSALGFYDFRLQSAVLWFIDDATSL